MTYGRGCYSCAATQVDLTEFDLVSQPARVHLCRDCARLYRIAELVVEPTPNVRVTRPAHDDTPLVAGRAGYLQPAAAPHGQRGEQPDLTPGG